MHAYKFGDLKDNDTSDEKIRILDNELGDQILGELSKTYEIEKKIFAQLGYNKRELRRKINSNTNELKDMVEKESYTIVLNNQLERVFRPPLECENCEIALLKFHIETIFFINKNSNVIEYKLNDEEWKLFRIKKGYYTISTLQKYLDENSIRLATHSSDGNIDLGRAFHIEFKNNKVVMRITKGVKLKFSRSDSIGKIFGFEEEYGSDSINKKYESNENNLTYNALINVYLNCIQNNYFNEEKSPIVYSFFQQINEKPTQLIYHPIKEKIKNFKVEVKDKDGVNIKLDNTYFKFHVKK